jgi:hypothetical protein
VTGGVFKCKIVFLLLDTESKSSSP